MECSEIQESVFSPDSASLHLGYVAGATFGTNGEASLITRYWYASCCRRRRLMPSSTVPAVMTS